VDHIFGTLAANELIMLSGPIAKNLADTYPQDVQAAGAKGVLVS